MEVEREIKFSLTPEAARRIGRQVRRAGPWRRSIVSNAYYDTASERLRRAGVALRLRRDGKRAADAVVRGSARRHERAEAGSAAHRGQLRSRTEALGSATGCNRKAWKRSPWRRGGRQTEQTTVGDVC